jgi:tRNA pseudouridine55 synthase
MSARSGVIVLDKPAGLTSNAALSRLKRALGSPKMGFLGTLDPLATGVLPVFVGKATKLIPEFERLDKAYRVTARLGETTDTCDCDGNVLERKPVDHLRPEQVREALLRCEGQSEQVPPEFSAIKHGGVPAYRLARAGKAVPKRTRPVRIWDVIVEDIALPDVTFSLSCSSGTYVRALARDLGEALGVGAHVTALRRLRCGTLFTLERARTLAEVESAAAAGEPELLLDCALLLPGHVPCTVNADEERLLRHGNRLPLRTEVAPGTPIKALSPQGELLAIGKATRWGNSDLGFQPDKVLV